MATPDSAASLADKLIAAAHAERLASARSLAKHYVLAAAGTALIPLPLAGLGAFMALQVKLVHGLATHYEVPFKENLARSLIAALLSGASWMVGMIGLASLAKAVPGLGSLAGGGGMAVTSASVTYAVGEVFIQHFEAGGTLLDFDPDKMKALFRRALKNGPATVAAPAETAAAAETPADSAPPETPEADESGPSIPAGAERLEDIHGIGEVYAERLRAVGIAGFAELASLPPARVKEIIGRPLSLKSIQSWISQADAFAHGKPPGPDGN